MGTSSLPLITSTASPSRLSGLAAAAADAQDSGYWPIRRTAQMKAEEYFEGRRAADPPAEEPGKQTAQFFFSGIPEKLQAAGTRKPGEAGQKQALRSQPMISKRFMQLLDREFRPELARERPDVSFYESVSAASKQPRKQPPAPVKAGPMPLEKTRGRSAQDPESGDFSFDGLLELPGIRKALLSGPGLKKMFRASSSEKELNKPSLQEYGGGYLPQPRPWLQAAPQSSLD